ncbi:molybdate ABC transporter substrate-binding protein [uncultured Pseudodesulfovibrio sp.]|uniref:molybdate ABC transporter substrate-binding protein n=1 Tax=uncultured Pseudodesulfovibrio sp. TaxID=2035858 RepID=UPI0029C6D0B6|nr:molybdate ABC transporter substrate-binding protein [uncultured Pseudodesulfovibrio sp.]
MKAIRTLLVSAFIVLTLSSVALADNAVLASGGGYKKMVNALNAAYKQKTGHSVDLIYGNMARVTTQAKQSGKVDIVLGDRTFLTKAELPLENELELGRGKLVLAFAKQSTFSAVTDLDNPEAGRIALPDTQKAIYGKAARQYLTTTKRLPGIKPRLVEVATVPQVFSYLTTKEVDMGFMNLTHTLNVADKLGGYIILNEKDYSPIKIIAAPLKTREHTAETADFLRFLETPEAKVIIRNNGL